MLGQVASGRLVYEAIGLYLAVEFSVIYLVDRPTTSNRLVGSTGYWFQGLVGLAAGGRLVGVPIGLRLAAGASCLLTVAVNPRATDLARETSNEKP